MLFLFCFCRFVEKILFDLHKYGITHKMLIRNITVHEYGNFATLPAQKGYEARMAIFRKDAAEKPAEIATFHTLADLNREIQENQASRKKMGEWTSNFLGGAIGLGVIVLLTPIKIPLLAVAAVGSLIGYFVSKQIRDSLDGMIAEKQKRREDLLTGEESKLSTPKPGLAVTPLKSTYGKAASPANNATAASPANDDADRLAALEQRVRELQDEIAGKPAVLEKPKSIVSKTGFGK